MKSTDEHKAAVIGESVWTEDNSIANKIRSIVYAALQEIAGDKREIKLESIIISHPTLENYGDYTSNIAFIVAERMGMKPFDIVKELAEVINNYIQTHQTITVPTYSKTSSDKSDSAKVIRIIPQDLLEKAEAAGNGFLNVWLQKGYLITQLEELLNRDNGVITTYFDNKKIMVEYAHPNTHKELHIGHMRTLITGEALSRILDMTGAKVFRANYQGDIGPHVAKAIWGTQKLLSENKMTWEEAEKLSLPERAHLLGKGYIEGNKDYEKAKLEIDKINRKLYTKDSGIWPVYERTRRWSLDYYNEFYKRFYTKFNKLYFESEVADCGKQIVMKNLGKVFEKSDGAIVFPGKKYGLHTRVFVTQDGNPTYEGKEMCLGFRQIEDFPFDLCVHVVANEQADYFKVVIKVLELIDPKFIGREKHLSMGMVNLVGRKISSRTGEIVTVDKLLDDVKTLLSEIIKEGNLPKEEMSDVLEKTTIGAVKYSVLKADPKMNVVFDLEKSVTLDGDSGPYLQYTYARCRSVLRKSEIRNPKSDKIKLDKSGKDTWKVALDDSFQVEELEKRLNPEELSLLRTIYKFSEIVGEAARTLSPNLVCGYLFDLAQKFNLFYSKHSILKPENRQQITNNRKQISDKDTSEVEESKRNFRLLLTSATSQIIRQGLRLLGIETVERM